jgi:hypothetical protein
MFTVVLQRSHGPDVSLRIAEEAKVRETVQFILENRGRPDARYFWRVAAAPNAPPVLNILFPSDVTGLQVLNATPELAAGIEKLASAK